MSLNVLIVDLNKSDRAKWISKAFSTSAKTVLFIEKYYKGASPIIERYHPDNRTSRWKQKLPFINLVMLHKTDEDALPKDAEKSCLINYTSEGSYYSKKNRNWIYWINREIREKKDVLKREEILELLEWSRECKEKGMPKILLPPQGIEILKALAVLCQGYLTVYAEYKGWNTDKNFENKYLRSALEQMGWVALKAGAERSLIPDNLGNKIGIVKNSDWWLECFNISDEKDKEGKLKILEEELKKEWDQEIHGKIFGDPNNLICMLKGREVGPPVQVANFYISIVERIHGVRC